MNLIIFKDSQKQVFDLIFFQIKNKTKINKDDPCTKFFKVFHYNPCIIVVVEWLCND